jgi:predicted Zn-dependent protease
MRIFPLLAFAVYMLFYYFHNEQRVPVTGRKHLVGTSPQQDAALGLQSYREILSKSQIVSSGPQVDMVKRVGERLKKVVDDPGFQWEFNLIQSKDVNAFCLPGGKVAIYTGILPVTQNDDGLAVVMGHEISHAIARHGAERMAQQKLVELGTLAVGVSASNMDSSKRMAIMGALGVGAQYGILLPFSREQESEADYMGLHYLSLACFDPTEAARLWQRMSASSTGAPSEFMSTHPSNSTRIHQFQEWMPEAQELRAKTCGSAVQ